MWWSVWFGGAEDALFETTEKREGQLVALNLSELPGFHTSL